MVQARTRQRLEGDPEPRYGQEMTFDDVKKDMWISVDKDEGVVVDKVVAGSDDPELGAILLRREKETDADAHPVIVTSNSRLVFFEYVGKGRFHLKTHTRG